MPLPPTFTHHPLPTLPPQGYALAPLFPSAAAAANSSPTPGAGTGSLHIVLRTDAKPGTSPFISLRDSLDARVYLAAIADNAGSVHQYMELWVQDPTSLSGALATYREALSNQTLDARWAARCQQSHIFATGFETVHPAPLFIDIKARVPIPARDRRTNAAWALCTDEALLAKKNLPGYAGSLSRHLYQPELGENGEFIPIDMLMSEPAALISALGLPNEAYPLNPCGGLLMLRPLAPLSFDQYCDAIKGISTDVGPGEAITRTIAAAAVAANNGQAASASSGLRTGGWLALNGVGLSGRLVESLHLQLMVLAGATSALRSFVQATQAPLLNLTSDSFRVTLGPAAAAVPLWWTARVHLSQPGEAAPITIPGAKNKYFLPPRAGGSSIFSPPAMNRAASGRGYFRPRAVTPEGTGMIVEGTLSTQDRVSAGVQDLLWLRASLSSPGSGAGQRVDLYAFVEHGSSLASGEARLRTLPQRLSEDTIAKLRSGMPIGDVSFEMIPNFSTPCDLYALGVLAVRTLLVDGRRALPPALDDVLQLASMVGREAESGLDLPSRIARAFEADPRFVDSLGPHRLLADCPDAKTAFQAIPPALWHQTLACIIAMFSGHSADSQAKEFGDAPNGAIHRVFDRPLEELYALLASCRALIVPDQSLSNEVRSVVRDCLAALR